MNSSRGIPTLYAGVEFRSRAEARWAAFFDIVRWPWIYEPFDEDGYIPDFILNFPSASLLVEVKGGVQTQNALMAHCGKLERAGRSRNMRHAMILGAYPFLDGGLWSSSLGLLGQSHEDREPYWWAGAWLSGPCGHAELTVYHGGGMFWCVRCGGHGGGYGPHWIGHEDCEKRARDAWAKASNVTKWQGASA